MDINTGAIDIALRLNGTLFANSDTHNFTGIDGRCMHCDCRPFGRYAQFECDAR